MVFNLQQQTTFTAKDAKVRKGVQEQQHVGWSERPYREAQQTQNIKTGF